MTSRAPAWFEKKYKTGAIHKMQSRGFILKQAVSPGAEIKGNTVVWKIAGTGEATPLSDAVEDRPTLNADRTTVETNFQDYEANEWIKKSDINKMTENEQQIAQQTCAMAMGRRFDSIILGTLDAAAAAGSIGGTIGDGTAAISITDALTAQGNIFDVGAGSYEYYCALPTKLMQQLEIYKEFSSSDFVSEQYPLLKQIGARQWRNVTYIPMPSKFFNVPAANQIDAYMWVKEALGFEWNNQLESRIDYVPTKKAYFAANDMGCAAAVLLPEGVQRLRFATNVALTRQS